MELRWLYSYETVKFDTPDGDLHKGQYAEFKGNYFIRDHPENNAQPTIYRTEDDRGNKIDLKDIIKGLEKIEILKDEHMYYDVFELPDGRLYRAQSPKSSYDSLKVKNSPKVVKSVTEKDILKIKEKDHEWL